MMIRMTIIINSRLSSSSIQTSSISSSSYHFYSRSSSSLNNNNNIINHHHPRSSSSSSSSPELKFNPSINNSHLKIHPVTYLPPLKLTRHHTKAADHALYDGLKIRSGHQVSKSKHRTNRIWKPNVQKSKLWSEVLGQSLQLRLTTAALRTIDQVGGLDRYVLQMSDQRLGAMGIRIRDLVIAAMKERVKLSKSFTQPIPTDQAWRVPQWQDASQRIDRSIPRTMVPSIDVHRVTVFPRLIDPTKALLDHPQIRSDFFVRGRRGSQTSRRSTHPRR